MISDLLLVLALLFLAAAAFLASLVAGFSVLGIGCAFLALAFSDGKGPSWRS